MKREKVKNIIYHVIMATLNLASLLCSIFVFGYVFRRTIQSFVDFGTSVAYYFDMLLMAGWDIVPTVTQIPTGIESFLPLDFAEFKIKIGEYFRALVSGDNISGFFIKATDDLYYFLMMLVLLLPIFIIIFMLLKRSAKAENNNYNKDSKCLTAYKKFEKKIILPVKRWFVSFKEFNYAHKYYGRIFLLIWLYNYNLFTIIIEAISFYFYFVAAFDIRMIYTQVVKLFIDLSVLFLKLPMVVWIVLVWIIIIKWRRHIGYNRLMHYENRNKGFTNSLGVVNFQVGPMGVKKTTVSVDMGLSTEAIFRDKAYELLLKNDMKFPFFPFVNFEISLRQAMEERKVYNLATCRKWVFERRKDFERERTRENCFDYDFDFYGLTYDNKMYEEYLFDVLNTYAQLYFIYVINSSLIIGNLSVRSDNMFMDKGNFPLWDTDFFQRDSKSLDKISSHAHILDFDILRLGKRIIEDNALAGSFEFGVVLITEVGKERGNQNDTKFEKRDSSEANRLNDLFNTRIKMARHSATVDNYPFIRFIFDDQRPESLGADARELSQVVHLRKTEETRLAMPMFFIEELLYGFISQKFKRFYGEYRFNRGDNTLFMYLYKKIAAGIEHYYKGIYNTFSYSIVHVQVEDGTMDGQMSENNYYVMPKKIYPRRFNTDCFSGFFEYQAERVLYGLDDYPEYKTEKPSYDELGRQHSYFINSLSDITLKKDK